VSYFRPQKAGKIGPRTIHSFSDSTSWLSKKAGQVNASRIQLRGCLEMRGRSSVGTRTCSCVQKNCDSLGGHLKIREQNGNNKLQTSPKTALHDIGKG
jgi:hypothetical protein